MNTRLLIYVLVAAFLLGTGTGLFAGWPFGESLAKKPQDTVAQTIEVARKLQETVTARNEGGARYQPGKTVDPFAEPAPPPPPPPSAPGSKSALPEVERPGAAVRVRVNLVLTGADGQSQALINGRNVSVGTAIAGWTVAAIEPRGVTFRRGQTEVLGRIGSEVQLPLSSAGVATGVQENP